MARTGGRITWRDGVSVLVVAECLVAGMGEGKAHVLGVRDGDRLVGAGAFYLRPDGTLCFMGEEHADFGGVLAVDDRADVIAAIVRGLFGPSSAWRRLELQCVLTGTPLARALALAGCLSSQRVPCPRVRFAARPLADLLAKDSLRRHERKLALVGGLSFAHLDAAAEIVPWLARFFKQHIERWSLTQTPSLFCDPRNREFYSELAGSAEPGGSLLFTIVEAGGAPVAMHFGLRSQDELLWYKPTFDPRLAASGPGEVLLAELLRRAGREGCAGLDFTRGGEAFKKRFASEVREVALYEAWPDAASAALARLGRGTRSSTVRALERLGIKAQVSLALRRADRALAVLGTRDRAPSLPVRAASTPVRTRRRSRFTRANRPHGCRVAVSARPGRRQR